jgi:hypothetical protein
LIINNFAFIIAVCCLALQLHLHVHILFILLAKVFEQLKRITFIGKQQIENTNPEQNIMGQFIQRQRMDLADESKHNIYKYLIYLQGFWNSQMLG